MQEITQVTRPIETSNSHNGKRYTKGNNDEIEELNRSSERIQQLIGQIDQLKDKESRELVQACISEMLGFYGKGLERILKILMRDGSSASTKLLNDLIEDNFVSGLLLIHDLHPLDLQTRLNAALEKVRPYMDSHGGNVEIVSLKDGAAKLKLSGSCKGCASSSVTMELAIKQAIEENCPDLVSLEVEGIVEPAPKEKKQASLERDLAIPSWKTINGVSDLSNGGMKFIDVSGTQILICKANNKLFAYRNSCPACEMPLSGGTLDESIISCRLGHRYDIQHAGICTDDTELHLDPFPLLMESDGIKIAIA